MTNYYLIIFILILISFSIFCCLKIQNLNLTISKFNKEKEKLEIDIEIYKEKFEKLLLEINKNEKEAYENGVLAGQEKNKLSVNVEPIENITNGNYWVFKKETIEIGFQYQLYLNNIPTEFKSTHILKTLKKSEVNEENIKKIINGIEQIESLKSGGFIISNSVKLLKQKLINQIK